MTEPGIRHRVDDVADDDGVRRALTRSLDRMRAAVVTKVTGLDDEQLRRPVLPSGWSLLGLLKHLAYVERWWFRAVMAGEDVDLPYRDDDPDAEWRVEPGDTTEAIFALYADECARARLIADSFDLTEPVRHRPDTAPADLHADLAWIIVHMLEETARHAGHADVVRELIDAGASRELIDSDDR
jgi:uncharacterized damage-inducible protein DinB